MILEKLTIALLVMFVCTFIHALFMIVGEQLLNKRLERPLATNRVFPSAVLIWMVIMWMFLGICVEAGVWAALYLFNPAITNLPDASTAFYFSLVTYTTLGYGDIVLTGDWRVLSAIQAVNGVIIFGWTTALIIYFIQRIYKAEPPH